jgi:3-oxoacyl-[acyl-carrier-protein] synthase-3
MLEASGGVGIVGLGSFVPPHVRGNDFWPADFKPLAEAARRRDILALERTTRGDRPELPPEIAAAMERFGADPFRGARFRHVIDDDAEVSDMEAEAVRRALADARVRPDEIDLVLSASPVPDRILPGNGPALQAKCELANAVAWNLEIGCAAAPAMLVAAAALVRTGAFRRVLIVASSALSRVLDYAASASPAFGDGAAAAVVGPLPPGRGVLAHWMRTDGTLREGAVFAPVVDSRPARAWARACGPIRLESFDPDSIKVAGRRAVDYCRESSLGALAAAGLGVEHVDLFVCAQSQGWFVDACRRGLDLPASKAIDTFPEVASLGPATPLYNLDRARRTGRLADGDVVLMYSPGVGLTRAAVVCRWGEGRA